MDTCEPWLSELTVTRHVTHAVEVLRAAIPQQENIPPDGKELTITRRSNGQIHAEHPLHAKSSCADQYEPVILNEAQKAAARFLASIFSYHFAAIRIHFSMTNAPVAAVEKATIVKIWQATQDRFMGDVKEKLNISFRVGGSFVIHG